MITEIAVASLINILFVLLKNYPNCKEATRLSQVMVYTTAMSKDFLNVVLRMEIISVHLLSWTIRATEMETFRIGIDDRIDVSIYLTIWAI